MNAAMLEHLAGLLARIAGVQFMPAEKERCGQDLIAMLPAASLPQAGIVLRDNGFFPEDLTVCDINEGLLACYHFFLYEPPLRLTLRLLTERESTLPSLQGLFPGMNWHEREAAEMFGLRFSGHPHLKPLLLDVNMDQAPLLKAPEQRRAMNDLGLLPKPTTDRHKENGLS